MISNKENPKFGGTFSTAVLIVAAALVAITSLLTDHMVINFVSQLQPVLQNNRGFLILACNWIPLLIPALAALAIYKAHSRRLPVAVEIILPAIAAFIFSQILHAMLRSARPYADLQCAPLLSHDSDSSFPSDRVLMGFALAIGIFPRSKKMGWMAIIAGVIAGIGQVMSLLHWPSDVVIGAFLGAGFGIAAPRARLKLETWLGPSSWRALFVTDEKFHVLLAVLRMVAVFGVLLRFVSQYNNLVTSSVLHFQLGTISNLKYVVLAIWAAFFLYVLTTNRALMRLSPLLSRQRNNFIAAGASAKVDETLWKIIIGDYLFYSIFYVLTGRVETNLFSLFILPLVTVSLLRSFSATIKVLALSNAALGISIFFIYAAGLVNNSVPPGMSPKQWLTLDVFAPRSFLLFLCCIPAAWLVEKHSQLERARAFYESLVERIPQMITRKDLNGIITYANKAFCDLNKLSKNEIVGFTDYKLYRKDMANGYRETDKQVELTKLHLPIDEKHRPFGAELDIDVEGTKIPVLDSENNVIEIQIIFWDITERRRREAQFDALMMTTHDYIYFKNSNSEFLEISQSLSKVFGLTNRSQAVGKSDRDYFDESHAQKALQDELDVMQKGKVIEDEEEEETFPDGSKRWVSTSKQCFYDKGGNLIGTFGISRNIQNRKESQAIIAKIQQELNNRLDTKLERASMIAHFGFWEWSLYDDSPDNVKAMDEVYRIFGFKPQQDGVGFSELRELVHPADIHIWNEIFDLATLSPPFSPVNLRLRFPNGTIKYLYAKSEILSEDEDGLPEKIIGLVQDVTEQKKDEIRAKGLQLAIRGFQHMIPGKAEAAKCGLEFMQEEGELSEEATRKALCFIFMILHKAYEVKSILYGVSLFKPYSLGEIWDQAWPIATDLARTNCEDLTRLFGNGTDAHMEIAGAFYTAAVNILSNARIYGTPPFVIWTFIDEGCFNAVFADGGPNNSFGEVEQGLRDHGVGLKLVERILEIEKGELKKMSQDSVQKCWPSAPASLLNCQTFFHVVIPLEQSHTVKL